MAKNLSRSVCSLATSFSASWMPSRPPVRRTHRSITSSLQETAWLRHTSVKSSTEKISQLLVSNSSGSLMCLNFSRPRRTSLATSCFSLVTASSLLAAFASSSSTPGVVAGVGEVLRRVEMSLTLSSGGDLVSPQWSGAMASSHRGGEQGGERAAREGEMREGGAMAEVEGADPKGGGREEAVGGEDAGRGGGGGGRERGEENREVRLEVASRRRVGGASREEEGAEGRVGRVWEGG